MIFEGQLRKMCTQNGKPVQYYLNLSGDLINMNQLLGEKIALQHIGYQCLSCNSDQKIFRMGFCKKCFFESPYASETIIRPELSKAHLGIGDRDFEVESAMQLVPHFVYLAYTGDVKVGVTRESQIPTRWIDQGATFALPIARTENRYEAGMIEVALKKHLPDKTNYKKMLQCELESEVDLHDFREKIKEYFPENYRNFYRDDNEIWRIDYPYQQPENVSVCTLEKSPKVEGILKGIKGQYLEFQDDTFINIRSHEGFLVQLGIG